MNNNFCRICGYDYSERGEKPWEFFDGQLFPSYEICACCGAEFGYDDVYKSQVIEYREKWASEGYPFCIKNQMPKDWSKEIALSQIEQVPHEWS